MAVTKISQAGSRPIPHIIWNDKIVTEQVWKLIAPLEKVAAYKMKGLMIANLIRNQSVDTGDLRRTIRVKKSKHRHGGYAVIAGNEQIDYAMPVETGHVTFRRGLKYSAFGSRATKTKSFKTLTGRHEYVAAKPFMRPAKAIISQYFRKQIKTAIRTKLGLGVKSWRGMLKITGKL